MEKVCFSQTDDPKGSGLGKMITTNCLAVLFIGHLKW